MKSDCTRSEGCVWVQILYGGLFVKTLFHARWKKQARKNCVLEYCPKSHWGKTAVCLTSWNLTSFNSLNHTNVVLHNWIHLNIIKAFQWAPMSLYWVRVLSRHMKWAIWVVAQGGTLSGAPYIFFRHRINLSFTPWTHFILLLCMCIQLGSFHTLHCSTSLGRQKEKLA